MKVESNRTINIERIMEAVTCLHIEEFDKNLSDFINTNLNYFYLENQYAYTSDTNEFKIDGDDNSFFSIKLSPNYYNLKHLVIRLNNLEGMLSQSYHVDYNDNEVAVQYKKQFVNNDINDNKKITKLNINTKYINGKKKYERRLESSVQENSDNNFTKEVVIYYPNLDESYVKSEININMFNSDVAYFKGSNDVCKKISASEFENIKAENNKVKIKTRKCG